jgi:ankyrin repeat protein
MNSTSRNPQIRIDETLAEVLEQRYGGRLRRAALGGRVEDVEALLRRGSDVNYVRPSIPGYVILDSNDTPLHAAAKNGQKAVVDVLIAAGADVNQRTVLEHSGRTTEDSAPVHMAVKSGHEDVLEALLLAGANLDVENATGDTALHMAASKGRKGALEILLRAGAKVNAQSLSGRTPLHEAVINCHEDIVEILLAAGGDPGVRNKRQETPLEAAKDFRSSKDEDVSARMLQLLGNYDSRK